MLGVEHYPVSAETELSFNDFGRMHREDRSLAKPAPLWAMSDMKVRKVVAARICVTIREPNIPETLEELRRLEPRYLESFRTSRSKDSLQHFETVRRHGGPAAYWTSLVYRRFRLDDDSVSLAQYFSVKPPAIRQQLRRLCYLAKQLFPDESEHLPWQHNAKSHEVKPLNIRRGKERPRARRGPKSRIDVTRAIQLRKQGFTYYAIAAQLGATRPGLYLAMKRHNALTPGTRRTKRGHKKPGHETPALIEAGKATGRF